MMDCSAETVCTPYFAQFLRKKGLDKRHGESLSDYEVWAGEQNVK